MCVRSDVLLLLLCCCSEKSSTLLIVRVPLFDELFAGCLWRPGPSNYVGVGVGSRGNCPSRELSTS